MSAFLLALPIGALLGMLYSSVRLAGVDFSKWYSDPAEPNEGDDRSWIGQMKRASLTSADAVLVLALAAAAVAGVAAALEPVDWVSRTGLLLKLIAWFLLGLLPGWILSQLLAEAAWRFGLHWRGSSVQIRLAREPPGKLLEVTGTPGRRRLVVCCDGTWNSPLMKRETNVVQLLRAIQPVGKGADGQPVSQISYYHLGVGTGNLLDRLLGGAAGIGLSSSVKACYGFLVDNYRVGDEILLFGFSRGAYVVRSVAGLIGVIGLVNKAGMFAFKEIWDYYTLPKGGRSRYHLDRIAPKRHHPIPIHCLGVWDTVGALGIPGTKLCSGSYTFHETQLGGHVLNAFHALAMDERRGNFQPAVWVKYARDQVLEQVWFPGVHSDIGGGYAEHGLADDTLSWMLARLGFYRLLDVDPTCVESGINRAIAEHWAAGKLHDSRGLVWKLIGAPVPRPVGITDDSERIHESANARQGLALPADVYARKRRKDWLRTIPADKVARPGPLEVHLGSTRRPPGVPYDPVVEVKRGLCSFLLQKIFGDE